MKPAAIAATLAVAGGGLLLINAQSSQVQRLEESRAGVERSWQQTSNEIHRWSREVGEAARQLEPHLPAHATLGDRLDSLRALVGGASSPAETFAAVTALDSAAAELHRLLEPGPRRNPRRAESARRLALETTRVHAALGRYNVEAQQYNERLRLFPVRFYAEALGFAPSPTFALAGAGPEDSGP